MKKIPFFFIAAIFFSTMATAQSAASLNLQKGRKYQVDNKIETSSSTDVNGQNMETKATVSTTYNIEVKDKSVNNYNLANTVSHVVTDMEMMGQQINFDSDKKEDMDGPMGVSLKDFINQPKDIQMDNSGKLISDPKDTSDVSAISKQLGFAQSGYGTEMAFLAIPKNAKVGATWSETTNDGGIDKTTNYTIKEINGNIATVAFNGTIGTNMTMKQNGMDVATKTTGKVSGEEKVDIKSGVIQSGTTDVDASGTVTVMGQDFPTSAKMTSTTTVKSL